MNRSLKFEQSDILTEKVLHSLMWEYHIMIIKINNGHDTEQKLIVSFMILYYFDHFLHHHGLRIFFNFIILDVRFLAVASRSRQSEKQPMVDELAPIEHAHMGRSFRARRTVATYVVSLKRFWPYPISGA